MQFSLLILLLAGSASAFDAPEDTHSYLKYQGETNCPADHRLMSVGFARNNLQEVCNLLSDWEFARLSGYASLGGPGNNCVVYESDHRHLNSSLCVALTEHSLIRGALIQGGFRSPDELTRMTQSDWRVALIDELANRTRDDAHQWDELDNQALAGLGLLVSYLRNGERVSDTELSQYTATDIRQSVIGELQAQTGIDLLSLQSMSNIDLYHIIMSG
ncbi:MAG: hypothetical protein CMK09_00970 [Ponticaulis sp.]|nr:hypothetical protein [Ponticaulis sp.]|tara:strand:- start:21091 stop:21741 length:651 start_codon:yes stop_codon:yes gene_type:complete